MESSGLNKKCYFSGFTLMSIPALDEEFFRFLSRTEPGKKHLTCCSTIGAWPAIPAVQVAELDLLRLHSDF
jgi:hypothetical protein